MRHPRRRTEPAGQSGTALLEMAVLVALLSVLVFCAVDMGRAIVAKLAVDDAVRVGVTYAAISESATIDSIESRMLASGLGTDLSDAVVTVRCRDSATTDGNVTIVDVSLTLRQPLITPIASWLADPLTIESSRSLVRRVGGSPCA